MSIDYSRYYTEYETKRKKRVSIDLHSNKLREFILKKIREKKRRVSKIDKKHYYQYGRVIDGYKYGALLWVREEKEEDVLHDSNKAFCYEVHVNFMYRLQSGLYIDQRNVSSTNPILVTETRFTRSCDYNNIPVGLATVVLGLGIPDTYGEAMFKNVSHFAHKKMINSRKCNDSKRRFTLCVQINIAILQLKGEDVLYTKFRCEVEGTCRARHAERIIRKEKCFQPLHIQEYCASNSSDCMGDVKEELGDCCSICLEELRGCSSYILPCSHVYHYHCIFKWMLHSNICPFCRHPYRRIFPPDLIYPLITQFRLLSLSD